MSKTPTTSGIGSSSTTGNTLGNLDGQVSDTAAALTALQAPAIDTADAIDQAFAKAGTSLSKSLAKAASDGKISLSELASAVISAVDSAAGVSPSSGTLGGALSQIFSAATSSFSGARAEGGPITAGGSYLVGERGPELFRPNSSGSIDASNGSGAPNVNVTLVVPGGAQSLVRSEAQVASALNRAARIGLR